MSGEGMTPLERLAAAGATEITLTDRRINWIASCWLSNPLSSRCTEHFSTPDAALLALADEVAPEKPPATQPPAAPPLCMTVYVKNGAAWLCNRERHDDADHKHLTSAPFASGPLSAYLVTRVALADTGSSQSAEADS